MSVQVRTETWVFCDSCPNTQKIDKAQSDSAALVITGYFECCKQVLCPDCANTHTRREHGAGRPL